MAATGAQCYKTCMNCTITSEICIIFLWIYCVRYVACSMTLKLFRTHRTTTTTTYTVESELFVYKTGYNNDNDDGVDDDGAVAAAALILHHSRCVLWSAHLEWPSIVLTRFMHNACISIKINNNLCVRLVFVSTVNRAGARLLVKTIQLSIIYILMTAHLISHSKLRPNTWS